jgi:phosphomannomutase/phosphoglucomutase
LKNEPPVKLALDAGNGTAGLVAPMILKKMGCEVVELFCQPDGDFPHHHPDPTVLENLKSLQEAVIKEGCDLGIAFDGDADRLGVIDESGQVVYGDKLLAIFTEALLVANPGASVLGEVKCSQVVFDWIERLGGKPIMWKTGHSLIKKKMKEEKVLLAGEMSGHFFFADRYFGFDDAIYAACRLVEVVKEKKKSGLERFSQLLSGLPRTVSTPEIRIECPDEVKMRVIEAVKEKLQKARQEKSNEIAIERLTFIDGVRIQFDDGWGLVRASNTQPALVLRFEAGSEEKKEIYRTFIEGLIDGCKENGS